MFHGENARGQGGSGPRSPDVDVEYRPNGSDFNKKVWSESHDNGVNSKGERRSTFERLMSDAQNSDSDDMDYHDVYETESSNRLKRTRNSSTVEGGPILRFSMSLMTVLQSLEILKDAMLDMAEITTGLVFLLGILNLGLVLLL